MIWAEQENLPSTGSILRRKIKEAQDVRHSSDYDDFYVVSIERTNALVENAKEVVAAIDEYVQGRINADNG